MCGPTSAPAIDNTQALIAQNQAEQQIKQQQQQWVQQQQQQASSNAQQQQLAQLAQTQSTQQAQQQTAQQLHDQQTAASEKAAEQAAQPYSSAPNATNLQPIKAAQSLIASAYNNQQPNQLSGFNKVQGGYLGQGNALNKTQTPVLGG